MALLESAHERHPRRRFGFVNAYLVREEDGLTLIDTAIPRQRQGDPGRGREARRPIVRIALTHAHGDHIGSLDALAGRSPTSRCSISARDARLLAGDKTLDPGEPPGKCAAATRAPRRGRRARSTPGDRVGSLEVIAAPGHTPGHVAFLDTRDRTLFAGDAYSTLGGVATTAKLNPRFPLPGSPPGTSPTALETASALRALEPARLAPGHGSSSTRPAPRWTRRSPAGRRRLGGFGDVRREQRVVALVARERVGDGEEGLGVDAHAAVRGADLDALVGLGVEAGAPVARSPSLRE